LQRETDRAFCAIAHLSDDETVAKMGHPNLDVGHPAAAEQAAEKMISATKEGPGLKSPLYLLDFSQGDPKLKHWATSPALPPKKQKQ
jgi:hypothetical protein